MTEAEFMRRLLGLVEELVDVRMQKRVERLKQTLDGSDPYSKRSKRLAGSYHERRAKGLCVECEAPAAVGKARCEEHAERCRLYQRRAQAKKRTNGVQP